MQYTSQSPFYNRSLTYECLGGIADRSLNAAVRQMGGSNIVIRSRIRANKPTLLPLAPRWLWYISD